MRGEEPTKQEPDTSVNIPPQPIPPTSYFAKPESLEESLQKRLRKVNTLCGPESVELVDPERQRLILKHLTAVVNILRSTQPSLMTERLQRSQSPVKRKISRVVENYKEYRFKKKSSRRRHPNTMNIKSFKNTDVLQNTKMSYTFMSNPDLGDGGMNIPRDCTRTKKLVFDVKRNATTAVAGTT